MYCNFHCHNDNINKLCKRQQTNITIFCMNTDKTLNATATVTKLQHLKSVSPRTTTDRHLIDAVINVVLQCTRVAHVEVDYVLCMCPLYTDGEGHAGMEGEGDETSSIVGCSRQQTTMNAKPQQSRVTSIKPGMAMTQYLLVNSSY